MPACPSLSLRPDTGDRFLSIQFFSITVYGPDKFLMTNKNNIVSSTRGVVTEPDGSFTMSFTVDDNGQQRTMYSKAPRSQNQNRWAMRP